MIYEVYVRSFADADGDGVGDLEGIRQRLPYLADLGVDAVWLTPFYPSPGVDHGYDVSDYSDVDPLFGTLTDLDALLADAHALNLRILIDLVANHTSREHPWFRERPEYYVWADEPPNNWRSVWDGPAWARDEERGRYYLHLFSAEQPDLDWHNPAVQDEFERILRFWLDRGVDGFRIDVAHGLFKDASLADEPERETDGAAFDHRTSTDRPEVHALYRRWRALADSYPGGRILAGEVSLSDPARVARYVRPDELQLAFDLSLLLEPWDAAALRARIDRILDALAAVGAPATWVLESHDVTRLRTRCGAERAAALLQLALPGAACLYAGQELGLEEVDLPDELRQDPVFSRTGGRRKGRDGSRVPLPWEAQAPGFGFTTGTAWLPAPDTWGAACVAAQERDLGSVLALYREALRLRPRGSAFVWRESPPGTLVFERGELVCAVNVGALRLELPPGEVVLASGPEADGVLPAGAAAWISRRPPRDPHCLAPDPEGEPT